jgi:hypothetical protein
VGAWERDWADHAHDGGEPFAQDHYGTDHYGTGDDGAEPYIHDDPYPSGSYAHDPYGGPVGQEPLGHEVDHSMAVSYTGHETADLADTSPYDWGWSGFGADGQIAHSPAGHDLDGQHVEQHPETPGQHGSGDPSAGSLAPSGGAGESGLAPGGESDPWNVVGTPGADEQVWHQQAHDNTCAVASQQFVIEQMTGQYVSENQLMAQAEANGWYTPGGGTPFDAVGNLLEAHGVPVQREQGASIADLDNQLANHEKVIVGVNAEDIWYAQPGHDPSLPVGSYPGIPGQRADHAVEVIGIDYSDPAHPNVILNDSGTPNGQGEVVPLDTFEQAWAASGNFEVHTLAPGVS